ncbi:hypothetical protein ACJIZ3_017345 [Penstemon smallii]|uniref:Uncharacterized protein n=1 Tax=Penstemon smallii TaxID=265156 RepID=A0ABD3SWH1_9LAMI
MKFNLLQVFFLLNTSILFPTSISLVTYCGNITIQEPLFHPNTTSSSLLSNKTSNPKELNCTYDNSPVNTSIERIETGTRITFDIPDHVPNPCKECEKPYGNCGAGLRCICHPKLCRDKVISFGAVLKPCGNIVFSLIILMKFL